MSGPIAFTLAHPYAPSVFATYLSAASLISAVEMLFNQEQQLSVRFLHFWFNSFSATVRRPVSHVCALLLMYGSWKVTLALLISRAPATPLAAFAFRELEKAYRLFKSAAKILPFSNKALVRAQPGESLIIRAHRPHVARHPEAHGKIEAYPRGAPHLQRRARSCALHAAAAAAAARARQRAPEACAGRRGRDCGERTAAAACGPPGGGPCPGRRCRHKCGSGGAMAGRHIPLWEPGA